MSTTEGAVSAEDIKEAWNDPKLANIIYHDWEAGTYDDKWSISYDERCITYARDRFALVGGTDGWPYGDALEIGCGTGFFSLNLKSAGVIDRVHVTDISPKMVEVAIRNGASLGYQVEGRTADAERIPYEDNTFDLVIGHAMLHHIPDVEQALRESLRVLKPGGRLLFAGEPTRNGDIVARRLSRATWWAATKATKVPGLRSWARPADELAAQSEEAHLESIVDLHTFVPDELRRTAEAAGATDVQVTTEEFLAAWFGWPVRTFECAVRPEKLGFRWATFAYKSWQYLSVVDRTVARRVVPDGLFYNVLITGVKPVAPAPSVPQES